MNDFKLTSKPNSVIASPNNRPQATHRTSERQYLAEQSADARAAIAKTLHEMNESIKRVVDVRSTAKYHPWITVGAAAATGFIAGALLTPQSKSNGHDTNRDSQTDGNGAAQESKPTKKSLLLTTIISALTGVLHSIVQTSITSAATAFDRRPDEFLSQDAQDTQAARESIGSDDQSSAAD